VAWAAFLFRLSAVPGAQIPAMPVSYADKIVHVVLYGILGALCFWALRRSTGLSRSRAVVFAALVGLGYGVSDELHQTFVPGRSAEGFDLLADLVGASAGALATRALGGRASPP
jgi:VanZ family protein